MVDIIGIAVGVLCLYLLADWYWPRVIRFQVMGESHWQIAFNQEQLRAKLDGRMAIVDMPARPLLVRLWRKVFPLKFTEGEVSRG